jgi:polyketide synthase 12
VAGVIKMVEAMRHGLLPRSLHCEEPSPHVDWSAGAVELLSEPVEWPARERPRRAGVSSFGVSGTNAHVILEEAPAADEAPAERAAPPALPLLVSAQSEPALRAQAERLRAYVEGRPDLEPLDVAFSLATARTQFDERAVVVGSDREALLARLAALAKGEPADGVVTGQSHGGKAVFVFPGQGSQWEGMALELLDAQPVFAESMRACGEALSRYVDWSLEEVLRGADGAPSFERVDVVQPALFAVMASLAALWRSYGVEPSAVVGHSQGEIAAAYVAGGLSLDDAARVVCLRSQAVADDLAGRGGMGSVALGPEAAEERLEPYGERLSLAAVNGPASVVVSGEMEALDELLAACEAEGTWARKIPVDYPSHSVAVEGIEERLAQDLGPIAPTSGTVPFLSTVSAELIDTTELDAGYWYRNLRGRVRFNDAVAALIEDGASAFLEMSPHPGLTVGVAAAADAAGAADRVAAVGSLRRGEGGLERFLASLGEAHAHGVDVDWSQLYEGSGARRVELPTYAFQHQRFWIEGTGGVGDLAGTGLRAIDHRLLNAVLPLPSDRGTSFTGQVSLARQPWLADHAVFGRVLLPGTAFADLLLAAGAELGCPVVEELALEAPLVLADRDEVALQVMVGEDDGGRREVEVYSRGPVDPDADGAAAEWVRHATGVVSDDTSPAGELEGSWPPADAEQIDVASMYDRLADAGFEYGPAFQGVTHAWRRGEETFCEVALGEEVAQDADSFAVHPALLDATFHAVLDGLVGELDGGRVPLPFALSGVRVHRTGASSLRVRLTAAGEGGAISLVAADGGGATVLELESVSTRPVEAAQLGVAARPGGDSLFRHEWVELALEEGGAPAERYAVIGDGLALAGEVPGHPDLDALVAAIEQGDDAPEVVFATDAGLVPGGAPDAAAAARDGVLGLLSFLQAWLGAEALAEARLALVTRGAVSVRDGEAPDPARAALWGLVRSAETEHPGRFLLVDLDEQTDASTMDWPALLAADEPQLAVRRGTAHALRVARLHTSPALTPPEGEEAWHLDAPRRGTLEDLALVESARAREPLGAGEVRIAMRAGGLNFRDVLIALGQYPDDDPIGSEGAGIVLEVGDAVDGLAAGDRVFGFVPEGLGPVAVADRRVVAPMPETWSFAEGASVPVVFATAYYGLVEIGRLSEGETVLVHAGAGGVGMAAIQIARHLGAEVYATASPAKWDVLRGLGLDDDHIASSRDLDFRERFLETTGGRGMDVVLNALAREYVDASLDLLPRGGRFVEMGKADVRDAEQVARDHAGVGYRAFDLLRAAGPDRVGEVLAAVLELFAEGALRHLPVRAWDVRHAGEAFRHLGDGRNVGKVVLTVPRSLDPEGTVLITGGTGDLGARVARHLAREHGAPHLLLVSRRGPDAPGAAERAEELRELGAEPSVVACDVTDRDDLSSLLDSIDAEHPLTAIVHTAGVLDDSVIESLTTEQVDRVLRPKTDATQLLHELTLGTDLAELVLFSSDAGTMGSPGQGNYAAANVFLDALAERRAAQGLPAKSLAWGLWSNATGMAGDLGEADIARLARLGAAAMTNELELFDAARASAEAIVVPTKLDMAALRAAAQDGSLPPIMREVVRARPRGGREGGSLEQQLAGVPESEREGTVLRVVREQVASVLGHSSVAAIQPKRKFKELGFDSLSAVELRNRLARVSGLRLPSTLVFDRPSPAAVSQYMLERLAPAPAADAEPADEASEAEIQRLVGSIPVEQLRSAGLLDALVKLARSNGGESAPAERERAGDVRDLDLDELVRMAKTPR